jgi:transcriptional regulator with PAS, ATPase and Fis domain
MKKPEKEATFTSIKEQLDLNKKENDTSIIRKALEEAHFCKSKTAKLLGISRTTLWRKLKEADVD